MNNTDNLDYKEFEIVEKRLQNLRKRCEVLNESVSTDNNVQSRQTKLFWSLLIITNVLLAFSFILFLRS